MFLPTLGWLGWTLLAIVPFAIIALYFLKLRRQPLEVPSTYLWSRTIEDLHVNSLWQRLRQSILLLLQLLFVLLLFLACLRPGMQGQKLIGDRFVFLVDNSASMSSADVEGQTDRLAEAKRRIAEMIDQMQSGDVAMLVSFADRAKIEQAFTDDRRILQRKLTAIEPTNRVSDISEALRVASGLANPGQTAFSEGDAGVAEAKPATLYIFSDGRFPPIADFTFGNLAPVYVPIGDPLSGNVGIIAFSTQRNSDRNNELQAYARIERFGAAPDEVAAQLYYNDELLDAQTVKLPEEGAAGLQFELGDLDAGKLRLQIEVDDALANDNVAYAAINPPRKANVLMVTPGNDYFRLAMATEAITRLARTTMVEPSYLQGDQYKQEAATGVFDVIIYDNCSPETMPESSTLFLGAIPPGDQWKLGEEVTVPQVIDIAHSHPLMNFIEMTNVMIGYANPVEVSGGTTLIDSQFGPLLAIAPRKGFEDAVLGFNFLIEKDGSTLYNTEWPKRQSFPVFVKNVIEYLGDVRQGGGDLSIRPGMPIELRTSTPVPEVKVSPPTGRERTIGREGKNIFSFSETDQLGTYNVREGNGPDVTQSFSVNIFDAQESNIPPADAIATDWGEPIAGQSSWEPVRVDFWKWIVAAAIVVLLVEWWIYNRRVYL
ncbi:vWA domain-containing protein [Blastopirellula marina]|uniref:Lipoprotein-like n=1 Tax=Blastopirellula marina DSM 3645 TaxID=314230 RepID=A3ZL20_9BACT|nr:BatA and WFA domain-containing protein [Blastopirellula marina]EAQ82453.1 lipoprotein-like [Blastopirellula marina DSM 3645]